MKPEIRLVLFDLDGTLITSYMDRDDKDFHAWQVFPDIPATLQTLRDSHIKIGVVTNQAGIAFGYNTEADFYEKAGRVSELLDIPTKHFWWCFAHPKADPPYNNSRECLRRKPNGAMIEEAMAYFGTASDHTLYVGDMETDREAARHAHVHYSDIHTFTDRDPNLKIVVDAPWVLGSEATG